MPNEVSDKRLLRLIIESLSKVYEHSESEVVRSNLMCQINIVKLILENEHSDRSLALNGIEAIMSVAAITPEYARVLIENILESVAFIGTKHLEKTRRKE